MAKAAKKAPAVPAVKAAPTAVAQVAAPAGPTAAAKAPKVVKAPKPPAATCSATKKDGTPCTSKVKAGLDTCVDHQPVMQRLSADQQESWNAWVGEQTADSIADLLGWHKVRDLIGEPVNVNPNQNPLSAQAAA